ncbi:sugar phosphate isomerase/epimerase family protein [Oceanithermus sp.]|uniref:sugar phosphate isomerase/epimerase family protein n=1 Tax=Oceanithermus sp. TaxID=2268145 RepID=UPI0025D11AD1|nr:sugar phosphate isomerase/epimerase family protein [Oceanithermus sp.]
MRLGYSAVTAGIVDPREALELAARHGLDIEISIDVREMFPQLPSAKELREMGRAAGVGFTAHLPFVDLNLASVVEAAWRTSLERMQRALEFSAEAGAQVGVLHTGQVPLRHPVLLEAARERLAKALELLGPPPLPVAVENLALDRHDLLETPAELVELVEGAGEGFGYTLDLPHAFVQGGEAQIRAYLEAMQASSAPILHLHLHDNAGDHDAHLPVGAGRLPYAAFKSALAGFEGTAALEVTGGAEGVAASLEALRAAWDI